MSNAKASEHDERGPYAETTFSEFASPLIWEVIERAKSVTDEPSIEGLHELRITLRRLRALWWSYSPLLDAGENSRQRELFRSVADIAGRARDYDILIELLNRRHKESGSLPSGIFTARQAALDAGREALSNPEMKMLLLEALSQTSSALTARAGRRSLRAFSDLRVSNSERQLHKRMRRAARHRRPNLAAFHDVRKAGKKVRYLLELFRPVLSRGHRKTLDRLKKIQKRFGDLNDVVASEKLLHDNTSLLADIGNPEKTLNWFERERKRRLRSAGALLRKGY